jgi:hypothetical protein
MARCHAFLSLRPKSCSPVCPRDFRHLTFSGMPLTLKTVFAERHLTAHPPPMVRIVDFKGRRSCTQSPNATLTAESLESCKEEIRGQNLIRLSPALTKNWKYEPDLFIAAFCRLIFLQLPSNQKDMAEACGSRTHHSTREGPNRRL